MTGPYDRDLGPAAFPAERLHHVTLLPLSARVLFSPLWRVASSLTHSLPHLILYNLFFNTAQPPPLPPSPRLPVSVLAYTLHTYFFPPRLLYPFSRALCIASLFHPSHRVLDLSIKTRFVFLSVFLLFFLLSLSLSLFIPSRYLLSDYYNLNFTPKLFVSRLDTTEH